MPSLRFKLPNSEEVTHVLAQELVSIGRRPDNTVQIIDRSVSGHHAELILIDGHYRLHDLQSTNLSFIEGQPVTDFHLRTTCKITFGNVECVFDAAPNPEPDVHRLTPAQLERDVAFLRGENSELLGKLDVLQRRIDILSSARLVTGKSDLTPLPASSDALRAITEERDDLRQQNSGLKLELEHLRTELALTAQERDQIRQVIEHLRTEHAARAETSADPHPASATQRITLPTSQLSFSAESAPPDATQKLLNGTPGLAKVSALSATV